MTAAFDDRIDALAPEITWYDLRYSLGPSDIPKFAWGQLLFHFGLVGATFDGLDPRYNGIETGNYELDLVGVAYTLPEGHHLDLQVSTTSAMHANSRTPAEVHLSIDAEIPVLAPPSDGETGVRGPRRPRSGAAHDLRAAHPLTVPTLRACHPS